MFAAIRHPDVAALGVIPQGVLAHMQGLGWYRVSPWHPEPSAIYLPDYAESLVDLDAPAATKKEQGK